MAALSPDGSAGFGKPLALPEPHGLNKHNNTHPTELFQELRVIMAMKGPESGKSLHKDPGPFIRITLWAGLWGITVHEVWL